MDKQLKRDIKRAVREARRVKNEGRDWREKHRRRTRPGGALRQHDLRQHIEALSTANAKLRSHLGRCQWPQFEIPRELEREMKNASYGVQMERRALRKMLR